MKATSYRSKYSILISVAFFILISPIEIMGQVNLESIGRWAYGQQRDMSFHPEDSTLGYIASGANLIVADFSDPLAPSEIYKVTVEKIIDHFILVDHYLYVGDRYTLRIYDLTDPRQPVLIKTLPLEDQVIRLFYDNDRLFQAGGGNLTIYDLEDRTSPEQIGVVETVINLPDLAFNGENIYGSTGKSSDSTIMVINISALDSLTIGRIHFSSDYLNTVEIVPPYLYVGGRDSLYILNMSDPDSPQLQKTIYTDWLYDIEITGNLAFFSAQGNRIKIYDITDHLNPFLISNIRGSASRTVAALPFLYSLTGGPIQVHDLSDLQNPEAEVALITFGASYNDIEIKDQHALLASYDVVINLDVEDPSQPVRFSTLEVPATHLAVTGNYCYFANRWNGWSIANISDASHPVIISSLTTADRVEQIRIDDHYAYLADWGGGIRIYDVSDPANPQALGSYSTGRDFQELAIVDPYIYAFERQYGLKVIDVSDKSNPVAVDSIPYPGFIEDIIQYENYLYLATSGGRILDISEPAHPVDLGIQFSWWTNPSFDLRNDTLYVTDRNNGLLVYKLADPLAPELIAQFSQIYRASAVKVDGDLIYLVDEVAGLFVLKLEEISTAVSQKNDPIQFEVFPVPAYQFINLNLKRPVTGNVKLIVQNQFGIIVREETFPPEISSILLDMSRHVSGSYFITLINGGLHKTEKIILVK